METLNTRELNEVMGKGLQIIEKFCRRNVAKDTDYNNLYDYLMNESMNYYYKLLDSEEGITEKSVINCFFHSINVLKLRHGILNNSSKVDSSVTELNTIGGGVDNKEYTRVIKSKYKIDRHNYIDYQSIANTYTNKSTRNEVEHGVSYVSIDNNEVLKNTLYSGLNPADELIKKEQVSNVKNALKPLFNDVNYSQFKTIVMSEKTLTSTQRSIKSRFIAKYPYLKELEKSDIIYLLNTYETL